MKLTVFNGSPRGKSSNTSVLMEHFLNGFAATEGNTYEIAYLKDVNDRDTFARLFEEAEQVILASPLYADAMPAVVKDFIESLEPLCQRDGNPDIGFVVQSGFPEPEHSRYLERYYVKLAKRLGCRYKGTVIRGGVEGIRIMPKLMNRGLFKAFYKLGEAFGKTGEFDKKLVAKLAKPERLPKLWFQLMRAITHKTYWDSMLKKNNAYDKRFDRPYVAEVKME
jgi:multimeric flavodoxin WrbA